MSLALRRYEKVKAKINVTVLHSKSFSNDFRDQTEQTDLYGSERLQITSVTSAAYSKLEFSNNGDINQAPKSPI